MLLYSERLHMKRRLQTNPPATPRKHATKGGNSQSDLIGGRNHACPSRYRRPMHGNPMKLKIYDGLPRRLHATPSRSLFSKDVEPPIAARRGGGGAATRRAQIPLLTRCIALVSMALRQSQCVPRAQNSAGCFMSIRGMLNSFTSYKIIESRAWN